ncbi:hypothetical protein PMAC_003161 [Pneumocystis sp. 'macacae']|nr:hypothetical protein PMAC_003161 [Pneumocystis sp. 'macacae']
MVDKVDRTRSIHGGYALYSGFLVALKQLIPEHTITFFKGILIKNGSLGILGWIGFLVSWVYLRFFKRNIPNLFSHLTSDFKGDTSETFGFSYFFPQPMHSLINVITKKIHHSLPFFHVYTPISIQNQQTESLNNFQKSSDFFSYLDTSRSEAERRRALALKELEQRLGSLTNTNPNIQLPKTESTILISESSNKLLIVNNENEK